METKKKALTIDTSSKIKKSERKNSLRPIEKS